MLTNPQEQAEDVPGQPPADPPRDGPFRRIATYVAKLPVKWIAGILIALLLAAGASLATTWMVWQGKYEREASAIAAELEVYTVADIRFHCSGPMTANAQACAREKTLAARERQMQAADLAAQQTVAIWTVLIAFTALIGIFLSTAGVLLVYTTFKESRKASKLASESADLSRKTFEHMKEATGRELRPYLTRAGSPKLVLRPEGKAIEIQIKNVGKTPARDVTLTLDRGIVSDLDNEELVSDTVGPGSIQPGTTVPYWIFINIPKDLKPRASEPRILRLNMRVDYSFAGGRDKFSYTAFSWLGNDMPEPQFATFRGRQKEEILRKQRRLSGHAPVGD